MSVRLAKNARSAGFSKKLARTLNVALVVAMTAGQAAPARASSQMCRDILGQSPKNPGPTPPTAPTAPTAPADDFKRIQHLLKQFELSDADRQRVLELDLKLAKLQKMNQNKLSPVQVEAEVSLLKFHELLITGDVNIAAQEFSPFVKDTEGAFLLMKVELQVVAQLKALRAKDPAHQTEYSKEIVKYQDRADINKRKFNDGKLKLFPILTELRKTLNTKILQDPTELINEADAAMVSIDNALNITDQKLAAGQPLMKTADAFLVKLPITDGGTITPVVDNSSNSDDDDDSSTSTNVDAVIPNPLLNVGTPVTPITPITPPVVPVVPVPPVVPPPVIPMGPILLPTDSLAYLSAQQIDTLLGSYVRSPEFQKNLNDAQQLLGQSAPPTTRPTLAEMEQYVQNELQTVEAIVLDRQEKIKEQEQLLWYRPAVFKEVAIDQVLLTIDKLPAPVQPAVRALAYWSSDNATRRRYLPGILAVLREPSVGPGIDGMTRVEKLFDLNIDPLNPDGLLVAYVRYVKSWKTWTMMKNALALEAYTGYGTVAQRVKDTNYANKFERLLAAEKIAFVKGDLSLTKNVSGNARKAAVAWSSVMSIGGAIGYFHAHPDVFTAFETTVMGLQHMHATTGSTAATAAAASVAALGGVKVLKKVGSAIINKKVDVKVKASVAPGAGSNAASNSDDDSD